MTPSPTDPPVPSGANLESLLAEGPWIRVLARGLLGEQGGEDLAQDVMAAAIEQRPELSGARLRGWFRTVARRMAARSQERWHMRAQAEERAAKPEQVEHDARARLALHRTLALAIDGLDAPYRTALILRYLEGLPPREIAKRLDIPNTTARKRVSRGLEQLRARLDEDFEGGREAWGLAVIALLRPTAKAPLSVPHASAALSPSLTIATIMSAKFLLGISAATIAAFFVIRSITGTATLDQAVGADVPLQIPSTTRMAASGDKLVEAPAGSKATSRVAVATVSPSLLDPSPRLFVLDETGKPVANVAAAWIDRASHAQSIELNEDGSARLPKDIVGARFYAHAPGFAPSFTSASEHAADESITIVLSAGRTLHGRVIEDGGAPVRPLRLTMRPNSRSLGIDGNYDLRLPQNLAVLGAYRDSFVITTAPDGSFEIGGLHPEETGTIYFPSTCRIMSRNGERIASSDRIGVSFTKDTKYLTVEVIQRPTILGRFVWEDNGEPLEGEFWYSLAERYSGSSTLFNAMVGHGGYFEIGLPMDPQAWSSSPVERSQFLLHRQASIGVGAQVTQHEVELDRKNFPIDLGSLRIPRPARATVRIVDPAGAPIAGALIDASLGVVPTDAAGLAQPLIGEGGFLQVLAVGFGLGVFPVESLAQASDEPIVLTLQPGPTLAIALPKTGPNGTNPNNKIGLAWDSTPFEDARLWAKGTKHVPYNTKLRRAFYQGSLGGSWKNTGRDNPGNMLVPPPISGPLLVPGLTPGGILRVSRLDKLGRILVEEPFVVPSKPGIHVVELPGDNGAGTDLRVRVGNSNGEPLAGASVLVRSNSIGRSLAFDCRAGLLGLVLLDEGEYELTARAPGFIYETRSGLMLGENGLNVDFKLDPARTLLVTLMDELGESIQAEKVGLRDEGTWRTVTNNPIVAGHRFRSVPMRPLELKATIGTRTWIQSVDPNASEVTLVVPTHGQLAIHLDPSPVLKYEDAALRATIRDPNQTDEVQLELWFTKDASNEISLSTPLLPGRYELSVDLVEYDDTLPDGPEELSNLLQSTVTMEAGEETRVDTESHSSPDQNR